MKSTSLLPWTLLFALCTSKSITSTSNTSSDSWPVSGFSVGCSPAACAYKFSVNRAPDSNNPGFNTSCAGSDATSAWQTCANSAVSAKLVPRTNPFWEVDVMHVYNTVNQEGWGQEFANATVDGKVTSFLVTVYETESVE